MPVVRTVDGNSSSFEVKVGMHQGSTLSPLLFVIVMEAISMRYGDGAGNTVEENSSVFSLIRMR